MKTNNWKSDGVKPGSNGVNAAHSAKRDWLFDVSAKFVRNRGLTVGARFLFVLLKSYQGADGTLPFPSLELLSDVTGLNRHTVQKYISELVKAGYIVKKRPRRSNGTLGSIHYALSWQPKAENLPMVRPKAEKPQAVLPQAVFVPYNISHLQHLPPSTSPTLTRLNQPLATQPTPGGVCRARNSSKKISRGLWRSSYLADELYVIDLYNLICPPRGWLKVNKYAPKLQDALRDHLDCLPDLTKGDLQQTFEEAATLRDAGDPEYNDAKGNKLIRILYRGV